MPLCCLSVAFLGPEAGRRPGAGARAAVVSNVRAGVSWLVLETGCAIDSFLYGRKVAVRTNFPEMSLLASEPGHPG